MSDHAYTHALWRVRDGHESDFVRAWSDLAETFSSLSSPPLWGTLLQSVSEPTVFVSFGPWASAADVAAMREDEGARAAIDRVRGHCLDATPGAYRLVRHVIPGS